MPVYTFECRRKLYQCPCGGFFTVILSHRQKQCAALALARQQGTYPVHVTYQRTCLRGVQRQDSVPASGGGLYRYGGFVQVYIFGL